MTTEKTLCNSTASGAKVNVADIKFWGDGDTFKLISKASSEKEGWMKSTKAMEIENAGCVVQVTTQQGDEVAEALTFVPNTCIVEEKNDSGEVVSRRIKKTLQVSTINTWNEGVLLKDGPVYAMGHSFPVQSKKAEPFIGPSGIDTKVFIDDDQSGITQFVSVNGDTGKLTMVVFDKKSFNSIFSLVGKAKNLRLVSCDDDGKPFNLFDKKVSFTKDMSWKLSVDDIVFEITMNFQILGD